MAYCKITPNFVVSLAEEKWTNEAINCTAKFIENQQGGLGKFVCPIGIVGVMKQGENIVYSEDSDLLEFCPGRDETAREVFFLISVFDDVILFHFYFLNQNATLTLIDCRVATSDRNETLVLIASRLEEILSNKYGPFTEFFLQAVEPIAKILGDEGGSEIFSLLQIENKMRTNFWFEEIPKDLVSNFRIHWTHFYQNVLESVAPEFSHVLPTQPTAPSLSELDANITFPAPEFSHVLPTQPKAPSLSEVDASMTFPSTSKCSATQSLYHKLVASHYAKLHPNLKSHQEKAVQFIMNGFDLVCLLPTGYGKTLAMIAPVLMKAKQLNQRSVHLVVSPLIALSGEFVEEWKYLGMIGHQMTGKDDEIHMLKQQYEEMPTGSVLHILTSPELLLRENFQNFLQNCTVLGFSIDEGHVVSLWSEDFRKDYGNIHYARAFIKCPLGVYSATVTPSQLIDIKNKSGIRPDMLKMVIVSPDRPELFFDVKTKLPNYGSFDELIEELKIKGTSTRKVIIFVGKKLAATELLLHLRMKLHNDGRVRDELPQYTVDVYTGSTCEGTRRIIEREFREEHSTIRVLIATSAFGMGLNINALYHVILMDLPKTMGEILQLGGRASRDGSPGTCTILLPATSTNPLSILLRGDTCIRQLLMQEFCAPTGDFEPNRTFDNENAHVCKLCHCCANCKKNCICNNV